MFTNLGDRVACAILKSIYPSWQVDDVKLKKILTALRCAFENRRGIEGDSDSIPVVSICLLEGLMARTNSLDQMESIQSAMDAIKQATHPH